MEMGRKRWRRIRWNGGRGSLGGVGGWGEGGCPKDIEGWGVGDLGGGYPRNLVLVFKKSGHRFYNAKR